MTDSVKLPLLPRRGARLAASALLLFAVLACRRDAESAPKPAPGAGRPAARPVPKAPAGDTTGIVAGVGSFAVTEGMVERHLLPYRRYLAGKVLRQETDFGALMDGARKRAVGEILLRHLLELETAKRGIRIPPETLDSAFSETLRLQHPDPSLRKRFLQGAPVEAQELKFTTLAQLEADTLTGTVFADSLRISDQELRAYYEANKANMQVPETLEEMRSAYRRSFISRYTDELLLSAQVTFLNPQYEDPSQFPAW